MPVPFDIQDFRQKWWPQLKILGFSYHHGLAAANLLSNCDSEFKSTENTWLMAGLCTLFAIRDLGHVCLPISELMGLWQQRLNLLPEIKNPPVGLFAPIPETGFAELLLATGMATRETPVQPTLEPDAKSPLKIRQEGDMAWLYLSADLILERSLANNLSQIRHDRLPEPADPEFDLALAAWMEALPSQQQLDPIQKSAIINAGKSGAFLLTGGPGTGKTTTVFHIVRAWYHRFRLANARQPFIALCAPTGRAAARMTESLRTTQRGLQAHLTSPIDQEFVAILRQNEGMTLHRLLGLSGSFRRDPPETVLPFDLIVVDEASMIDLYLMHCLTSRLAEPTKLILVGDPNQLPSIESGAILSELTANGGQPACLPNASLKTVFRSSTQILECAQAILKGDAQLALSLAENPSQGLQAHKILGLAHRETQAIQILSEWIKRESLAEIALECAKITAQTRDKVLPILFERANRSILLSPVHEGIFGTIRLNDRIAQAIRTELLSSGFQLSHWLPGMMVMVIQNDYERGLFNGDRGLVYRQDGILRIYFPGNAGLASSHPAPVSIPGLEPAYALTIHKSQGSEFDRLHLFLAESTTAEGHISRELLYTGITRAKSGLTLVIDPGAFDKACTTTVKRWTRLRQRLEDLP